METTQKCFVVMPSGNYDEYSHGAQESNFVFDGIIAPAVKEVLGQSTVIVREIDRRTPGAITKEIVRNTILSDVVIVDITGQNPNVFFELGMRFALRRNVTVLLRQESTPLPFDISTYRCVAYSPLFERAELAKKDLCEALREGVAARDAKSDSLVFDTFPDLLIEIPGVLHSETDPSVSRPMRWSVYWDQVHRIVGAIHDEFTNGRYVPTVVVGISNGGMMYADLLGRELFHRVPILALWANRMGAGLHYFENQLNDSLIKGICEYAGDRRPFEVLVVDDIVASGNTIRQALDYLKRKLPEATVSFLPLFCRNEKYFDNIRDHFIWFRERFEYLEEAAKQMHRTDELKLPYEKDIRSA
jgi:hypoxanthine phosphoribosyltransferase